MDVYDPELYVAATPHPLFQRLRQQHPVFWQDRPDGGGYWVLSRHADILAASRDHQTFSSERGFVLIEDLEPELLEEARQQLLGMDPPRHAPLRRMVITRFTGQMLKALESHIEAIVKDLFERMRAKEEAEFVFDLAAPLPSQVIAEMMGIPRPDWKQFQQWADKLTAGADPEVATPEESREASMAMGLYGYEMACRRQGKEGEDLTAMLLAAPVEGRRIRPEEFASLFVQIAVAGNETTRTLLAGGTLELIKQPQLFARLRENPALVPGAVEEMLRHVCPLHYFRRTATRDVRLHGQQIRENDRVVLHFDEIRLTGPIRRLRSNLVNGIKEMPVQLQPRSRTAA